MEAPAGFRRSRVLVSRGEATRCSLKGFRPVRKVLEEQHIVHERSPGPLCDPGLRAPARRQCASCAGVTGLRVRLRQRPAAAALRR